MPFALTTIGVLLIIVGFQDTYKAFFSQLGSDFSGNGSFIYWVLAIGIVGSAGYIDNFKKVSDAFLFLIIVAMFLAPKNIGFFNKFGQSISSGSATSTDPVGGALPPSGGGQSASSNPLGGLIGSGPLSLASDFFS